jgi:hypothetical protein
MTEKTVIGCFLGTIAFILYRDFKTPDPAWPLGPVPPPYRFTYAGVIFGILLIVADVVSPKVAGVVAIGVLIGTATTVFTKQSAAGGLKSNAPGYKAGGTASANPVANNGVKGTTPASGGVIQA